HFRLLAVIFTCNHCPTAQSYEERIMKLVRDYRDKEVGFIAISPNDPKAVRLDELGYTDLNDTFEEMKIRARDKEFNFPYLYDGETQKTSKAYGAIATPHVFLFNDDRKLLFTGRIDSTELRVTDKTVHSTRDALDQALAGKPIEIATTKIFGCSVKWSDKRNLVDVFNERWAKKEVTLETIDESGIKNLIQNPTDKVRLINVWATWCGPCVAEFPDLVEIQRMYGHRAFELVTISADKGSARNKALRFLKEQQAATKNFIFSSDDSYSLIEAVDKNWAGALPYTLLVQPGGKVIMKEMGAIDPLAVKRKIIDAIGKEKDW
ncbi:MAG TPA: redoxin domain-containing protein, partial [Verrucomicrobia bacterium]|nr:redoxin domain-containing protein [Verrucomicrobiota bacterium]